MTLNLLLVSALCVVCVTSQNVCQPPTPSTDKAPDEPVVAQEFETHIVLNILSKNMTTELHQFFSFPTDHSVIYQAEYGQRYQAYANYDTNEFIAIFPDTKSCHVDALNQDDNRFLFGYKKTSQAAHVPAAAAVMHLLQPDEISLKRYVGKQTVRGIPCRVWYACTHWEDMKSTMDVYYYFSDPDAWRPGYSVPGQPDITRDSVPVRAWVKGVRFDTPSTPRNFEHKYDFFGWKSKILRPYYWQTPRGVSCPGRKNTKPLPNLPQQFSFTLEQVDQGLNLVTFVKESYDYNDQFFQFTYRASGNKVNLFGDRMLTELHDFNTGVAYITDIQRGNCSVMPIEYNSLDDVNADQTHVQIRTAVQFLYLDGVKPTYEGVKQIRGMDADVWVAVRPDFPKGSGNNVTWEFAFLSHNGNAQDWKSIEGLESTEKGGMPVQLTLTQGGYTTYYNFYNFVARSPNILDYSIKSCYYNRNRRVFHFTIDGKFMPQIMADMQSFKRGVIQAVVKAAQISKLRVGNLNVNMNGKNTKVRVVILDVAPIAGDAKQVKQQTSLQQAGDQLMATIQNGNLQITPLNPDNVASVSTIPVMASQAEEDVYTKVQPFNGYGPGVVAATVIAMLIVGFAIGGALAVLKKKFVG